jgi:CRISPR-associated protein Cas5d
MGAFPPLEVKVWSDWACFTRPDAKVERVSYPVMTPSAARGVLDAIFWKPQLRWLVRSIDVLRPIKYMAIRRNEVTERASPRGRPYLIASDPNVRAQRSSLVLRDVAYVIRADVAPLPGSHENEAAYRDQFRRRVLRGQCFRTPYLGCREFSASFGPPERADQPIDETVELGHMLFDLRYETGPSGRGTPVFFEAKLVRGRLAIPAQLYAEAA